MLCSVVVSAPAQPVPPAPQPVSTGTGQRAPRSPQSHPGLSAMHQQVLEPPGSSLKAGRDLEMTENGDRRTGLWRCRGGSGSWALLKCQPRPALRGAGLVPGHQGAEGPGRLSLPPRHRHADTRDRTGRPGSRWEKQRPLGQSEARALWCCPPAEKPIRNRGSESGAGSPAGCLPVSGLGRKQAELAGACGLLAAPRELQAPSPPRKRRLYAHSRQMN